MDKGICGCPEWADTEASDLVLGRKEEFWVRAQELKDRREEARRLKSRSRAPPHEAPQKVTGLLGGVRDSGALVSDALGERPQERRNHRQGKEAEATGFQQQEQQLGSCCGLMPY